MRAQCHRRTPPTITSSSAAVRRAACSRTASATIRATACCCSRPGPRIARRGSTCRSATARRCSTRSTTGASTPTRIRAWTAGGSTGRADAASAAARRSMASSTCAASARTTTRGRRQATAAGAGTTCCRISCAASRTRAVRDAAHGADGPLACSDIGSRHELIEAIIRGAQQLGVPRTEDFNAGDSEGVGYYQLFTRKGLRCSTATGYLRPVRNRSNLEVQTDARVTRVVIEDSRATGVEYVRDGVRRTAAARARGDPRGRRFAESSAAAALGHRSGRAASRLRHSRRPRTARGRREPAGPPADAPALSMHESDHDQRRPQFLVAHGANRPAVAAHALWSARRRHQSGRPVHARAARIDHAGRPVPFRDAFRRPRRGETASISGLHVQRVPAAADVARTCPPRLARPVRGTVDAAVLPLDSARPALRDRRRALCPRAGGHDCGRSLCCRGIAPGAGCESRRRAARVLSRLRCHDLPSFRHVQHGPGRDGGRRRPVARARRARAFGSSTARSCRHSCQATPMHRW